MPPCANTQQLSTGCSAWVPCGGNDRSNAMGALVGFGLVSGLFCFYLFYMSCCHGSRDYEKRFLSKIKQTADFFPCFMMIIVTTLSIIGLEACSDYDHFTSVNGVRMDFIAVQSCVTSCRKYNTDTQSLFCGDKAYDLTGFATPDFNASQFKCTGMPVDDCQSCYEKRYSYKNLDDASAFIKLHVYTILGIYFVMVLTSMALDYELGKPEAYSVSEMWIAVSRLMSLLLICITVAHLAFFIYGVSIMNKVQNISVTRFMNQYIGPYNLIDIVFSYQVFGAIFSLAGIYTAYLYWKIADSEFFLVAVHENLSNNHSSGFDTKISSKDLVRDP